MRIHALLWLLLFSGFSAYSQEFGANPPSVKWQQVNTPEARVVYPRGLDTTAQRIAAIVHYLNRHTGITAGTAQRKINIVLQNQTTLANGYVGLAPWRSEFFLTPRFNSFDLGSLPWAENLAIHEYRHVQQYMNYRKGLSKLAYIILGEEGQAVANSAAIPNWFFEGDAVFQETAVSGQGRGRLPVFFNGYRSLWKADKKYSFMKLRNGSLRHYMPDHYALGYLLTGYGREKYGDRFWTAVTDDAARFKGLFYPFQKAVKKYAGITYSDFVENALQFYKDQSALSAGDAFITAGNNRYVSDYSLPYFAGEDSLVVLKKTYRSLPAWWLVTAKGEEKIRVKDIARDDYYAYRNGKIIYTAYEPDARWGQRDYSVIKVFDIATKQTVQLTHRSKYFQPDIAQDGTVIVAVQFTPDQQQELHVLDAATGALLHRVPQPAERLVYTYPAFYGKDHVVSCVRNAQGLMTLAMVNLQTGATDNLLPWSYEVKGFPFLKGDTVYFSAGSGYQDDIFAVDIKTRNLFKLTNEPLGAYQPAVNNAGRLVWSSFTAEGLQLKEKHLKAEDWQPLMQIATINAPDLYLPGALQQTGGNILDSISYGRYPVSTYGKLSAPFNFHSWRPYYEQPEWSFTVYGQNILNTFQSQLYYTYNENEGSHKTGFAGVYGAWFPWVTGGVSYTFNRKVSDSVRTIRWNELNANIGVSLPLDLTKGRWYKNLTLASSFNVEQLNITGKYKDSIAGPLFNYLQFSVNWGSQTQQAVQHINPHFAQRFLLRYRTVINDHRAHQLLTSASLYFPGIGVNHSLVLSGAFQVRDTADQYRFSNNFPFARGYNSVDAPRMWKGSVNYHLPLAYPDWGFAQIVYCSRIRANLFFDYARAKSLRTGDVFSFRSTGTEVFFDTKWWNQQPVTFGIRYSRLIDKNVIGANNANLWEFILPVDLLSR
ncbi:hypothetical protein [Agriterribacter sp.]|uniref:hypothetical protein n=1 Tax=Agriterribacter sp. TaxID=2821509 RepID=UPI002BAFB39C|nr:hypothetical protein [Agriterribacter sp.]HRO45237.1 hypothetical protein [Agriterribacter sp.]HRQ16840.1 hypothetical protein [Agriterribacter sp.]